MKFLVLKIVLCVFLGSLDALTSEESTLVTETCCSHAESLALTSASSSACAASAPPEEIEPDQIALCKDTILSCCEQFFKDRDACTAGMKFASMKKCGSPPTEIGKTCCEECSIGSLSGEGQSVESCGSLTTEGVSPMSALRKNAYYECCLKAAAKPTTTTEEPVKTTTEKKKPKETCSNYGCEHNCDDKEGVVRCSCKEGFRLQPDKKSCKDINECAESLDDLCTAENTVCHNVPGAFKCVSIQKRDLGLSCPPGFKRNLINQVCDDINECQLPRPPCPKYLCENTVGGYKCAGKAGKPFEEAVPSAPGPATEASEVTPPPKTDICPPGFRAGDDDECLDIDECNENQDDCQRLSQHCINTHGSFFCQDHVSKRCSPGFKVNAGTGICEDIDECEESSEVCKRSEVCINLPGAYNCKSKISQLPKLVTNKCQEGTRLRSGGKVCEDIDECREGTHLCDQFQNCINTFGAHECRCKNGFELDSASGSCLDIDECALKLDNCGPGLHCLNELGSFACTRRPPPAASSTTTPVPPLYDYEYDYSNEDIPEEKYPEDLPTTSNVTFRPTNRLKPTPASIPAPLITTTTKPTTTTKATPTTRPTTTSTTAKPRPYPTYPDRRYYTSTSTSTTTTSTTKRPYIPSRTATPPRRTVPPPTRPIEPERIDSTPAAPDRSPDERPSYDPYPVRTTPDNRPTRPSYPSYPTRPETPRRPDSPRYPTRRPPVYPPRPGRTEPPTEATTAAVSPNKPGDIFNPDEVHCLYGFEKDASGNCVEKEVTVDRPLDPKDVLCLNGFESDVNGNCVDIDECESGRHICGSLEKCVNKAGGYSCECVAGFVRGDDGWCAVRTTSTSTTSTTTERAVTESTTALSSHDWYTPRRPGASRGGRYPPVICELGYTYDQSLQRCVDIDECSLNTDTCAAEEDCVNVDGGFKCICGPKCRTENEKPTYVAVQPASRPPSDSGSNVITVGAQYGQRGPWSPRPSYSRDPNSGSIMTSCPWGYKLTIDKRCYDVDECASNKSECGPQQRCENFYGGYSCQCPAGHKLAGQNDCGDIDECMHGNPCSYNAQCINTVGSYRCECTDGFKNAPQNDKVCVDVNECTESPDVCHQGCANAWGSYRCYCKRGYRLDNDNRTCADVDECKEWSGGRLRGKLCGGECINEPGSYRCDCPHGYRLADDQRSCVDIDECETGEASCARSSDPGYVCQNTRGSYHCHHIDCPSGYRLESKHRCSRIKQSCRVSDWTCLQQPSTYSYNFITFVANIYLPTGSVDLFTMHGPSWIDSVVSFEMRMVSVQASPGVTAADLRCFDMRPSGNICAISLLCSLEGPQVAELELTMSLYQHGQFAGSAVARLIIIVSQYEF